MLLSDHLAVSSSAPEILDQHIFDCSLIILQLESQRALLRRQGLDISCHMAIEKDNIACLITLIS